MILDQLDVPIVLAPLAGGPTTPQLAAAVSNAGGLGFLAAGLPDRRCARRADPSRQGADDRHRSGSTCSFPAPQRPTTAPVTEYAARWPPKRSRRAWSSARPRFDDDDWDAKLALLTADRMPVTSFTFGCPEPAVIKALQAAGSEVWVTVTTPAEAVQAADAGADVLVVQGSEAGGHRGSFIDDPADDTSGGFGLLSLLQLVRGRTSLPLVAAGGIGTGAAVAAVLAAGAAAAQLGTAFLRCPEAGTSPVQRAAVARLRRQR